ncbi:helix-turn-helix transcriptional regulator [Arthrobacter sp. B2a2-09]|uniref:helix-turn-helix transcriptional regulator n=1 Tax=Arthrobacter sp. B2a2-09 TaxID=2952822 RepID=UPI0022CD4C49|nr:helix-turn-helix transcriptional regulator [Arthrobacter sp. B2a2-09]MCZ9881865.1 helix-turn-helix domain-containing protein [Arthrobacter sp. B2a2-09]
MPSFEARNPKNLGAAIKHARTARGMTQEQLAEDLGIPRLYLVSLENGTSNLWATRMFRTLRRLGIKVTVSFELPAGIPHD